MDAHVFVYLSEKQRLTKRPPWRGDDVQSQQKKVVSCSFLVLATNPSTTPTFPSAQPVNVGIRDEQ